MRLKQIYAKEGKRLRWKAGRYGHARQFRRIRKFTKRQRTIVGRLLRDFERRLAGVQMSQQQFDRLQQLFIRVRRILNQGKLTKAKLYTLHAPEVECISKGKARKRYEFEAQRRHLRRRLAIEPVIGHPKSDNRMVRCWL